MDSCITENCTPDKKAGVMIPLRRIRRRKFTLEFLLTVPDKLSKGATVEELAESVGGTAATLLELCRRNKISLPTDEGYGRTVRTFIRVKYSTVVKAKAKARELGVSTNELFERMLDLIAEDNMFNAVLDDDD